MVFYWNHLSEGVIIPKAFQSQSKCLERLDQALTCFCLFYNMYIKSLMLMFDDIQSSSPGPGKNKDGLV